LVLALFLFTYDKVDKKYYPVSYALIVSIIIITVYNSIIHNEQYNTNVILHINNEFTHFLELYSINLSFVLSLIYIFIYTYNDIKILESKILTVFSILLLIIGFIYSPALLLAMGLLFLGYYKRDNFLIFLGISLFLFFLGYYYYYYNEYISLLHKSIIFLISGTSFLIMGFYIKHRLSICKKN